MPRKPYLKCYFGCRSDGPLHKFPNPNCYRLEDMDRFLKWKSVLEAAAQCKGDNYIFDNIRICDRHFEPCYRLPSHRLTRNAVPSLFLEPSPIGPVTVQMDTTPGLSTLPDTETVNYNIKPISVTSDLYTDPRPGPSTLPDDVNISSHWRQQTGHQVSPDPVITETHFKRKKSPPISSFDTKKPRTGSAINYTAERTIAKLKNKVKQLKLKYKKQTKLVQCARKLSMKKSFLKFMDKLPESTRLFTCLQLKGLKKPRGRRFSEKEKIMALTIYKQSPKAYKLLQKMFVLPSKRCIQNMLSAISLTPGVNNIILENLKNAVEKMNSERRMVNLLFDEISLAPGLEYNANIGKIIGFEDLGTTCRRSLADHALVLMIKGIKSKYKQPICYSFCKGSTKAPDLKEIIKNTILKLTAIGLNVVATVCDQATTNVKVIKMLQNDTKIKYLRAGAEYKSGAFEINDNKIYPLYDTPHLLKGVRNNLLTKNATFQQNGETKWAKWEHLIMLLNVDIGDDEIRLVNKLTECHVIKDKIPKMKVKHAAQVFSQRVSAALRFLARHKILLPECGQTADFLLIFDQLFDSFNGHSYQNTIKKYKSCLKSNSPHVPLWNDLLPILESIKFQSIVRRNGNYIIKFESVPSIRNWIHNIKIFKEMWADLNHNHNVTSLLTRNFNQDPLENFFGSIRSNGIRNINPSCNQFISAYKTLIINNFNSLHSPNANCEKDDNNSIQSLIHLINKPKDDCSVADYACEVDSVMTVMGNIKKNVDSVLYSESKKYVTGFIIKKCKTNVFKKCSICMRDFCNSVIDLQSFNYEIDYTKKSLFYPSEKFNGLMNDIYYLIVACLREFPESYHLKDKIKFLLNCACDYNMISCDLHKNQLIEYINDLSIKLIIHSWCTGVNRILNGKISRFDKDDPIKKQAYEYYMKNKRINH